jgi:hypothetical protein
MSANRLGKIEKWILIHCYMKTVKGKLPDTWVYPQRFLYVEKCLNERLEKVEKSGYEAYGRTNCFSDEDTIKQYKREIDEYWKYLITDDIYLNYFQCELSGQLSWGEKEHFGDTPNYATARATLSRTISQLEKKNYINKSYRGQYELSLTKEGIERAKQLSVLMLTH